MSVKYSLASMRNPLNAEEPEKVYAKAQARSTVDMNRIADEIAYASSLTDGDVLNVIRGLIRKIREHLADGDIVSLGEFGTFQYQISSKGAESVEQFTTANIKKVRIQFRPGSLVKEGLNGLKFERVISVKARKQAAKQNEQEEAENQA